MQLRINQKSKEDFFKFTKMNGEDPSTLVRNWITKYNKENSVANSNSEILYKLYDAGYELQQKMGGLKKANPKAYELNQLVLIKPADFLEKVMELHVQNNLPIPTELIDVQNNTSLGQSFLMGLHGEKRDSIDVK